MGYIKEPLREIEIRPQSEPVPTAFPAPDVQPTTVEAPGELAPA